MIRLNPIRLEEEGALQSLIEGERHCDFSLHQLRQYRAHEGLLGIFFKSELSGFIAFRVVFNEAELDQILVGECYRRRGLAKQALTEWHEHLCRIGVKSAFLEVSAQNTPALALYQLLNYQQIGLRKDYYRIEKESSDALVLKKEL